MHPVGRCGVLYQCTNNTHLYYVHEEDDATRQPTSTVRFHHYIESDPITANRADLVEHAAKVT